MKRLEFMAEVYKSVQEFEATWNQGQRGDDPDLWPDELEPEEWWDQFLSHLQFNLEE